MVKTPRVSWGNLGLEVISLARELRSYMHDQNKTKSVCCPKQIRVGLRQSDPKVGRYESGAHPPRGSAGTAVRRM